MLSIVFKYILNETNKELKWNQFLKESFFKCVFNEKKLSLLSVTAYYKNYCFYKSFMVNGF